MSQDPRHILGTQNSVILDTVTVPQAPQQIPAPVRVVQCQCMLTVSAKFVTVSADT